MGCLSKIANVELSLPESMRKAMDMVSKYLEEFCVLWVNLRHWTRALCSWNLVLLWCAVLFFFFFFNPFGKKKVFNSLFILLETTIQRLELLK